MSECVDSVSRGTTCVLECAHCAARESSCAEDGEVRARARVWWSDLSNPACGVGEDGPHPLTPSPRCGEGELKEGV